MQVSVSSSLSIHKKTEIFLSTAAAVKALYMFSVFVLNSKGNMLLLKRLTLAFDPILTAMTGKGAGEQSALWKSRRFPPASQQESHAHCCCCWWWWMPLLLLLQHTTTQTMAGVVWDERILVGGEHPCCRSTKKECWASDESTHVRTR